MLDPSRSPSAVSTYVGLALAIMLLAHDFLKARRQRSRGIEAVPSGSQAAE